LEKGCGARMIKKLDKTFLDEIILIHEKAIYSLWDKLKRKYSDRSVRKFVLGVFDSGEVYGYFDKKNLIGVMGVWGRENALEIIFLLVYPEYQGKGIGKRLMNFAEDKTHGECKRIFLDVLSKNPAVGFYKKIGYSIISEKKGKYAMERRI
jgi:ribosomal protein S18 acetylase RimI-like enzyme